MMKSFAKGRQMKNPYNKSTGRTPVPLQSDPAADVVFIAGGLKAALNCLKPVRKSVISDVSKALNCEPEDLEFLFTDSADAKVDLTIFDFPDSERRRQIIRNNFLDAAE